MRPAPKSDNDDWYLDSPSAVRSRSRGSLVIGFRPFAKPPYPPVGMRHGLLNSNSIVLRVQHGRNVFLFPGDSYGSAYEEHLQASVVPEKLKATVRTAPHHGFNPGYAFPKMTHPQIVVASCLADYPSNAGTKHPRSPGEQATEVFVSAWHGNADVVSDGETVKRTTQRDYRAAPAP